MKDSKHRSVAFKPESFVKTCSNDSLSTSSSESSDIARGMGRPFNVRIGDAVALSTLGAVGSGTGHDMNELYRHRTARPNIDLPIMVDRCESPPLENPALNEPTLPIYDQDEPEMDRTQREIDFHAQHYPQVFKRLPELQTNSLMNPNSQTEIQIWSRKMSNETIDSPRAVFTPIRPNTTSRLSRTKNSVRANRTRLTQTYTGSAVNDAAQKWLDMLHQEPHRNHSKSQTSRRGIPDPVQSKLPQSVHFGQNPSPSSPCHGAWRSTIQWPISQHRPQGLAGWGEQIQRLRTNLTTEYQAMHSPRASRDVKTSLRDTRNSTYRQAAEQTKSEASNAFYCCDHPSLSTVSCVPTPIDQRFADTYTDTRESLLELVAQYKRTINNKDVNTKELPHLECSNSAIYSSKNRSNINNQLQAATQGTHSKLKKDDTSPPNMPQHHSAETGNKCYAGNNIGSPSKRSHSANHDDPPMLQSLDMMENENRSHSAMLRTHDMTQSDGRSHSATLQSHEKTDRYNRFHSATLQSHDMIEKENRSHSAMLQTHDMIPSDNRSHSAMLQTHEPTHNDNRVQLTKHDNSATLQSHIAVESDNGSGLLSQQSDSVKSDARCNSTNYDKASNQSYPIKDAPPITLRSPIRTGNSPTISCVRRDKHSLLRADPSLKLLGHRFRGSSSACAYIYVKPQRRPWTVLQEEISKNETSVADHNSNDQLEKKKIMQHVDRQLSLLDKWRLRSIHNGPFSYTQSRVNNSDIHFN